ncbi:MAG: hypothetical protein ACR2FM_02630 [Candidatus Saccharimonadales bacterium]
MTNLIKTGLYTSISWYSHRLPLNHETITPADRNIKVASISSDHLITKRGQGTDNKIWETKIELKGHYSVEPGDCFIDYTHTLGDTETLAFGGMASDLALSELGRVAFTLMLNAKALKS